MSREAWQVYFDYTCDDSLRLHELVQLLDPPPVLLWRTFSLKENRRSPEEPSVFESEGLNSISILALALSHAARDTDFGRYHSETFAAFHRQTDRATPDELFAIAASAGVDVEHFRTDSQSWLEEVAEEHRSARDDGVFGTPTLGPVGAELSIYVEIGRVPRDPAQALASWEAIKGFHSSGVEKMELAGPVR